MPDRPPPTDLVPDGDALSDLEAEIIRCTRCPRLVDWREEVAREKRAAYADETYWGKPVPGFGDPEARLLVLGLAPGAHGANRTGRMFTGDASGDFLYPALHRAGLSNQPEATDRHDGLELRGVWITAPVRCVPPKNKPKAAERHECKEYLDREIALLPELDAVLALGGTAHTAIFRHLDRTTVETPTPRPSFEHGTVHRPEGFPFAVVDSYHVSQRNTRTGLLTEAMFDEVLARAKEEAGIDRRGGGG